MSLTKIVYQLIMKKKVERVYGIKLKKDFMKNVMVVNHAGENKKLLKN